MKAAYKGDWRVKEYKPYTEKLEEYITDMEGQLDVLLAVIDGFQERMTSEWVVLPVDKGLAPMEGTIYNDATRDLWGQSVTSRWP